MKSGHMDTTTDQAGFGMIEVLVTLVILMVGLLGLAGLMIQSQRSEIESYHRVQALLLVQDMVERINANRDAAACYAFSTSASTYAGNGAAAPDVATCAAGLTSVTAEQKTRLSADVLRWHNLLSGTSEARGGSSVGAMEGARGCVSFDAVANTYLVTVTWQGGATTWVPLAGNCASGTYGDDRLRRAIGLTVKIVPLLT